MKRLLIIKYEKKKILLIIFVVLSNYCFSQTLGQDAAGFSSIVVPTTTFNLDITNNVGTFSLYQNFHKKEQEQKLSVLLDCRFIDNPEKCLSEKIGISYPSRHYWTWGTDVKGAIKDGIGTLFSNENVASSASLGGMIGYNISHTSYRKYAAHNIAQAYNTVDEPDKKMVERIKKIDPKLILDVARQVGVTPASLTPPAVTTNINEQVIFYTEAISSLSNASNIQSRKEEKIEKKNKRVTNLNFLSKAVDDIITELQTLDKAQKLEALNKDIDKVQINLANLTKKKDIQAANQKIDALKKERDLLSKNPVPEQNLIKIEIYKKYYALKDIYNLEYPTDNFNNFFLKSDWETKRTKIGQDLFLANAEIQAIQNQESSTAQITELIAIYKDLQTLVNEKKLIEKDHINKVINENISLKNHLIYLRGNTSGSDYKYDLANDSTKISERFADRHFNGYNLELGYTLNFRKYNFLGISSSINYLNNIYALTTTTFKLDKVDPTITDGSFKSSEEIKALSGTYDAFLRYDLNFDFVHLFQLKENPDYTDSRASALYVSINPYLRHRIYEKSDTLKNNTVVGVGLHTYNSKDNKIMGGIFIQTNDLFGVHTDDESTLGKRISFGIIAKYAITGLKLEEKK